MIRPESTWQHRAADSGASGSHRVNTGIRLQVAREALRTFSLVASSAVTTQVLADIDSLSNHTGGLGTVALVTVWLPLAGWAGVVWVRARRRSRTGPDARN